MDARVIALAGALPLALLTACDVKTTTVAPVAASPTTAPRTPQNDPRRH